MNNPNFSGVGSQIAQSGVKTKSLFCYDDGGPFGTDTRSSEPSGIPGLLQSGSSVHGYQPNHDENCPSGPGAKILDSLRLGLITKALDKN